MWVMVLAQGSERTGLTPAFWIVLAVTVLPTLVVLAMMTIIRREFRNDFPHVDKFDALKADVEDLPRLVEKTDKENREARNSEFGRLRDSIDGNNRELRDLVKELRGLIETVRGENIRIAMDFAIFKEKIEGRVSWLEKEEHKREQRRGA